MNKFLFAILLCFLLLLINYGIQCLNDYIMSRQKEEYKVSIREKIIRHFFYDNHSHTVSEVQNRLTNDLVQAEENYINAFFDFFNGTCYVCSVAIQLLFINWILLSIILLIVLMSLILPKIFEQPMQRTIENISKNNAIYILKLLNIGWANQMKFIDIL